MKRSLLAFSLALGLLGVQASPSRAAEPELKVTSQSLEIREKEGLVRFEGGVKAVRSGVEMTCDKLTLNMEGGASGRIRTGLAEGNVVVIRGTDRLESARAEFDFPGGKVTLTGSPVLARGNDLIRSTGIVYLTDEGRALFQGPVEAVIVTGGPLP